MTAQNPARQSAFFVAKNAKDVKINKEKVKELAEKWVKEGVEWPSWPEEMHFKTNNQRQTLDYLIILDSLNFCFWNKKERWKFNYNGKDYNGYYAWSLALRKFFKKNPNKGNLEYFSKIKFSEFKNILQSGKNFLFLKERFKIARAVSKTIIKKYNNSENFIESANQKFSVLVDKIYKELPYFNDVAIYKGQKIHFLKRAQILSAEIWAAFRGQGIGKFKDLDYLTGFADYKVPQILNYLGVLNYSEKLNKKIENKVLIKKGSKEEVEIRGCMLAAIECLHNELVLRGKEIPVFLIDHILWNKTQEIKLDNNYHLTKTIFY